MSEKDLHREMNSDLPLVTIGMPTRNRATTLRAALDSALGQSYAAIEVVVSDNASADGTQDLLRSVSAQDDRLRVIRQSQPITMLRNHEATWRAARGEFFIWLADDDLLSQNFIEGAVKALGDRPDAVLAMGELRWFYVSKGVDTAENFDYRFTTDGLPRWKRLWRDRHSGYEVKGVFRKEALSRYGWYDHTVSPDWPLLTYLMLVGEVIHVPEIVFFNGTDLPESGEDRARLQSFSSIERFPMLKLSWRCGLAARDAARQLGSRTNPVFPAGLTLASLLWTNRKNLIPNLVEPIAARLQKRSSRRG